MKKQFKALRSKYRMYKTDPHGKVHPSAKNQYKQWWEKKKRSKLDIDQITDALRVAVKFGALQAARELNLSPVDVHNWLKNSRCTKSGIYSLPNLLALVRKAKVIWQANLRKHPFSALTKAVKDMGFSEVEIRYRLKLAGLPTVPGFPLYEDPEVQLRCEAMGRGERLGGNRAYDPPAKAPRPPPVAPAPIEPVASPASSPPDDGMARYLAARTRLQQSGHLRKG